MSRPVLAGLVGRSPEWVKHVETGRLHVPRLPMLIRLAEVLGIADLADLTGDQSTRIPRFAYGEHPTVPAIRDAVQRYSLMTQGAGPPPLATLRERVAAAWRDWHQSPNRRSDVGAVLPRLLVDSQDAVAALDGQARREANAVLAEAYHLAQHVLVNAAPPELLWLVVERGMTAAQAADQPLALAGAAWTVGNMLRIGGRMDEALNLVHEAADLLERWQPAAAWGEPHRRFVEVARGTAQSRGNRPRLNCLTRAPRTAGSPPRGCCCAPATRVLMRSATAPPRAPSSTT